MAKGSGQGTNCTDLIAGMAADLTISKFDARVALDLDGNKFHVLVILVKNGSCTGVDLKKALNT